jgi:GNAT acetyltransferase
MQVLAPHQFAAVLPLVPTAREAGHLAMAHAVIEGTMPGHVLADRVDSPRAAFVLNHSGFHTAFGAPPREPIEALVTLLATQLVSPEPGLLVDVSGRWAAALRGLLPGDFLRDEYHAPAALPAPRPLPAGYRLVPITAAIARQFDGAVDPWVVRIWGGPEAFVARAFGFAVLAPDGALASFCTTLAIGGGEAEVEVGTNEAHRARGLAHAASCAFMAAASARGLVPAWTTSADNRPSQRLAASLGYVRFRQVACFPIQRQRPST